MQGQKPSLLAADGLLLTVALVWGFGFVAQRAGMEHVGPFTFNGVRFLLGALALVPLAVRRRQRIPARSPAALAGAGLAAGLVLFAGASLQQVGLQFTTAGRAGFITGLYVIFVPILGMCIGRRTGALTWLGGFMATAGMYLLSVRAGFAIGRGDLLVLTGALFWAVHVLVLDRWSRRFEPVALAAAQFFWCGLLSCVVALVLEPMTLQGIRAGLIPILYGGLVSVGIGYTLQVVAQQWAHPAHAAILLSLESVFAALGGWWLLDERLDLRARTGCALMLAGMIVSQLAGAHSVRSGSPDRI